MARAMCLAGSFMLADCHSNLDFIGVAVSGGATGSGGLPGTGGMEVVSETGGNGSGGKEVVGTGGTSATGSGGVTGTGGTGTGGAGTGGLGRGGTASGGSVGSGGIGAGGLGGRGFGGAMGPGAIGSCQNDTACAPFGLHCLFTPPQAVGRCVECLADGLGHCPTFPRVRCDTDFHRCVDCSTKVACPGGRCNTAEFRCLPATCGSCADPNQTCHDGMCVDCEVGDDSSKPCPAGLSCTAEALCIGCTADAQCATTVGRRLCDAIRGLCVQCRTSPDCVTSGRFFCNERTGTCF